MLYVSVALLRYAARQAAGFRVAEVTGVEAEMELPFAGIHQLCATMLGLLCDHWSVRAAAHGRGKTVSVVAGSVAAH